MNESMNEQRQQPEQPVLSQATPLELSSSPRGDEIARGIANAVQDVARQVEKIQNPESGATSSAELPSLWHEITDRVSHNLQTTIVGAIGVLAPLVAPMLVPAPLLPVVYGGIAVANALIAQRDIVSAAGMAGSLAAQAMSALGVPFSEWVVAAGAGFFGLLSKDAR